MYIYNSVVSKYTLKQTSACADIWLVYSLVSYAIFENNIKVQKWKICQTIKLTLDVINCYGVSMSQMTMVMFLCRNHNPHFSHSRLATGILTIIPRRMPLMELELPILHLTSAPVVSCSIFSFLRSVLQMVVCPFVLFLLAIVLSVLLRYTDSVYPFGIFKLF